MGFPDSSVGKEATCNAEDPGSTAGSGRSAGEGIGYPLQYSWASLVAQLVTNPSAMWETWVRSLAWKERLPTPVFWPGELGHKESDTTERLSLSLSSMTVFHSLHLGEPDTVQKFLSIPVNEVSTVNAHKQGCG